MEKMKNKKKETKSNICITPSAFTIPKGVTITLDLNDLEREKKEAIDLYKANALEEVEKAIEEKRHDSWGSCAYTELENLKTIKKYLLYGSDMKPSEEKEIELKLEKLRQYEIRDSANWCPKCTPLYPEGSLIAIEGIEGGLKHHNHRCSVIKAIYNKKWYEFWK